MDLNLKKYGLEEQQYGDNHLAMFGGKDPVTGAEIKGQLQLDAEKLGLEKDSLQLQKEELFLHEESYLPLWKVPVSSVKPNSSSF